MVNTHILWSRSFILWRKKYIQHLNKNKKNNSLILIEEKNKN